MRLRNKIIAMAVVAVAGFNTYLANDIRVQRNELSLLNLENIAEGLEVKYGDEIIDRGPDGTNWVTNVVWLECTYSEWEGSSTGNNGPFGHSSGSSKTWTVEKQIRVCSYGLGGCFSQTGC